MEPGRFSAIFRSLSENLRQSPFELFLFFLMTGLFVAMLIVFWRYRSVQEERVSSERVHTAWKKYLEEYGLNSSEIALVNRLAQFLTDPDKRYILLVNQHTFLECLHALKQQESPDMDILMPLAMKLGYRISDPREIPRSSRDLVEGVPVAVVDQQRNVSSGLVSRQLPNSLVLVLPVFKSALGDGEGVVLFFHNFAGLFELKTRIQKKSADELWLAHSDNLIKIQRRSFFRKRINLPIHIRREGVRDQDDVTQILDMSLGGMSLINPGGKYRKGDDLSLYFFRDAHELFHLYGEVVRISRSGSVLHLKFGHLSTGEQDRIASLLNSGHL